jgi:hypothetical protein
MQYMNMKTSDVGIIENNTRGKYVNALCVCVCIEKFPDKVDNEINNNKHSLGSNTRCYGGETH